MEGSVARILMIDDDESILESIRELLEAEGYDVQSVTDGVEGVRLALETKPDLVILDVIMKVETEGLAIARALHENAETKDIPIIIMSGVRSALKLGGKLTIDEEWLPVSAILEKPVKPAELLENISKLLKSSRKRR